MGLNTDSNVTRQSKNKREKEADIEEKSKDNEYEHYSLRSPWSNHTMSDLSKIKKLDSTNWKDWFADIKAECRLNNCWDIMTGKFQAPELPDDLKLMAGYEVKKA